MTTDVLTYTPIEDIPAKVERLRKSFVDGRLRSVDSRLDQLRKLYFAIKDHEDDLKAAVKLDLNKPETEFQIQELNVVLGELLEVINGLKTWAKPKSTPGVPLLFKFSSPKIIKDPLGVVLVIGAFNFPLNLNIQPVVAAIAAGNTVVLKQSELVPNFTETLSEILVDALDPEVLQVVNGAVDETTALLDEKFDKIIYTGNGTVGKIVAKKAAEHLTPVLLELGGKSPVFITENYPNLKLAAKRVAMAKNSNAGQVCISPDYILAHESVYEDFIEALQSQYDKYYGDAKDEKGYGKIVHDRAFKRLESTLEDTQGKIVYQNGELNASSRFFPPTIVRDVTFEDSLMKDEIFGPILPVIKYSDLDDAIDKVITYHDTPLALYVFTKNKAQENKILSKIRSGAALVNDALVHAIVSELPFGGVGNSGQGNYHGIHGFNSFSHDRAYLNQPDWTESLFEASFPPVSNWDLKLSTFFLTPSENINRVGPVFKKQYWFHGLVLAAGLAGSYFGFAKSCKG